MKLAAILTFLPILSGIAGVCVAQPSDIHERLPVGIKWKFHLEATYESEQDHAGLSSPEFRRSGNWSRKRNVILDGEFELKKPLSTTAMSYSQRIAELATALSDASDSEDIAAITSLADDIQRLRALFSVEAKGSIEGTASGSVEVSETSTPLQSDSLLRSGDVASTMITECAMLPTATYALPWVVGGYFSPEAIVLMVGLSANSADLTSAILGLGTEELGWKDPRRRTCRFTITHYSPGSESVHISEREQRGQNLFPFTLSLQYKNGEQTVIDDERTSGEPMVLNDRLTITGWSFKDQLKISLESECPISLSGANPLLVTVTPTLSPNDPPNNTLSKSQLAHKSGAGPGQLVGGWVQSDPWSSPVSPGTGAGGPRMKMDMGWDGGPANFGGNSCIWVDDIDSSFELPVAVYIASEYVPGSCQFNAVLNHEKKHLQSFRDVQKAFAAAIEAEIKPARWIPSKANPLSIPTGEVNSARTVIKDRIHRLLLTGYRSYVDKLAEAKKSVDTPAEMNRLEAEIAACVL